MRLLVWHGKSDDLTCVRQPETTVTIDANVPPTQTVIYLFANNTAVDAMIDTDAVVMKLEKWPLSSDEFDAPTTSK